MAPSFPHPLPGSTNELPCSLDTSYPASPWRCCSRLVCALPPPVIPHKPPHAVVAGALPAALSQAWLSCTIWFVLSAFAIPSSITNSRTNTPTLASLSSFFRPVGSSSFHLLLLLLLLPFPNIIVPPWFSNRSCIRTFVTITLDLSCRRSSFFLCFCRHPWVYSISCTEYEYLIVCWARSSI